MSDSPHGLPEPAIDGPWRANSYGAKIAPARNGRGLEELRLAEYSSFAIYGEPRGARRELVEAIERQANRQPSSIILSTGAVDQRDGIQGYMRGLLEYAASYLMLLRESRILRSPNGKYLLALIYLSEADLSDVKSVSMIGELIGYSEVTAIRPIFILENPRLLHEELQQRLSWQAFLGGEQTAYLRDRYTAVPSPGMATREPLGVALDGLTGAARVLNSLSYNPTADALELKEALANDRASYERFLEGLIDGK